MNRRTFHRCAAAAAFGLLARNAPAAVPGPWNLGIITDQVDLDLARVLRDFYPKYGLRWAEIRELRFGGGQRYAYSDLSPAALKQIRAQLNDAGVRVSVLDTAIYKVPLPGAAPAGEAPAYANPGRGFAGQLEDVKRAAEAAHVLGTERVRIFTFLRTAHPESVFDRVVAELQRALDVAARHGVTLLVENEYDCNVATAEETARLFRAIPDRRLMHNWDPCNCYEMGEQPFPFAWNQLDHSRISHIHLKDASGKAWKPIGAGEIDFLGQFRALAAMGYSGTLSLETRYKNEQRDLYASSVESMDGLLRILGEIQA